MPLRSSTASTATSGISMSVIHAFVPSCSRSSSSTSRNARSEAAAHAPRAALDSSVGAGAGVPLPFFGAAGNSRAGRLQGKNAPTSTLGSKSERSESSR